MMFNIELVDITSAQEKVLSSIQVIGEKNSPPPPVFIPIVTG